jgi:putative ABC transport system ATP-binding protein
MSHRADQYAKDLSGGEQQRVAVGRALAKDSEIILADEPTAHLDSHRAVEVIELLRNVSRTYGRTVILVTHDGEQAKAADHKITLRDGLVVSDVMQ